MAFVFVLSTTNGLQTKEVVIEQRVSSTLGKYLAGHVFKTTSGAIYPQHCLSDCWVVNDRCQSFNFLVDAGICELNDATNLTHPQDFVDRHRVVYLTNPVFGREKVSSYFVSMLLVHDERIASNTNLVLMAGVILNLLLLVAYF